MAIWKDLARAAGDATDLKGLTNYLDAISGVIIPAPGTPLAKRNGITSKIRNENRPTQQFQLATYTALSNRGIRRMYVEAPPLRSTMLSTSIRDRADLVAQDDNRLLVYEFKSTRELGNGDNHPALDEALLQLLFYATTWMRRANDWHDHFKAMFSDSLPVPKSVDAVLVTDMGFGLNKWLASASDRLKANEVAQRLTKSKISVYHCEWSPEDCLGSLAPISG
jgi:hypothetical protein